MSFTTKLRSGEQGNALEGNSEPDPRCGRSQPLKASSLLDYSRFSGCQPQNLTDRRTDIHVQRLADGLAQHRLAATPETYRPPVPNAQTVIGAAMPDHVICPAIYLRCLSRSDRSFLRLDGTDPAPTVPFGMRHKPLQLSAAKACGLVWNRSASSPGTPLAGSRRPATHRTFRSAAHLCGVCASDTVGVRRSRSVA